MFCVPMAWYTSIVFIFGYKKITSHYIFTFTDALRSPAAPGCYEFTGHIKQFCSMNIATLKTSHVIIAEVRVMSKQQWLFFMGSID